MDTTAKKLYEKHKKELLVSYSVIETAKAEGEMTGEKRGEIKSKIEVVLNSYDAGFEKHQIAMITKLSEEDIDRILKEHGKI